MDLNALATGSEGPVAPIAVTETVDMSSQGKRKQMEDGRHNNNTQAKRIASDATESQPETPVSHPEVIIIEDDDQAGLAKQNQTACGCKKAVLREFQCQVCHDVVHKAHGE